MLPVASLDDLYHLYALNTVELHRVNPLLENSSVSVNYILFKKLYFFKKTWLSEEDPWLFEIIFVRLCSYNILC